MKRPLLVLLVFVLASSFLCPPAHALAPEEIWRLAADAYYKNRLSDAEGFYRKLMDQGYRSGDLFYNLGNIAYRKGRIGEAIVFYERARSLLPRDADIRANLKFVESKRLDQFGPPSLGKVVLKTLFFWNGYLTKEESMFGWMILLSFFWILSLLFLLFRKNILKGLAAAFLIISVVFGLSLWFKLSEEVFTHSVIVVNEEVDVRPALMEQAKTLFKLHEGAKLNILSRDETGDGEKWFFIETENGQRGWILAEDAEVI